MVFRHTGNKIDLYFLIPLTAFDMNPYALFPNMPPMSIFNFSDELSSKPLLVALTGAGISAESGIPTFRDSGGIWDEYDLMEVGTAQGWASNPGKVLEFVNDVKTRFSHAQPNRAHHILAELEAHYRVAIVTQNIDSLHEEAGSTHVLHIHGRADQVRSTQNSNLIYDWPVKKPLQLGDTCELGSQLRPHTVFFGEDVLGIDEAERIVSQGELVVVIGTSLQVIPAAGLILSAKPEAPKFLIDPEPGIEESDISKLLIIPEKATTGMAKLWKRLVRD